MAYLGQPVSAEVSATASTDTFTGNGGTSFTLSRSVRDANSSLLEVFVSNVQQQPAVSYSVAGNQLSFTQAPSNGEPIYVIYRDYAVAPVFSVPDNVINSNKLQANSVTTAKINNAAVTSVKLGDNAVTSTKINNGAVTSAKINVDGDINFNNANIDRAGLGTENVSSDSNVLRLNYANATFFISQFFENTTLTPNNVPAGGCVMVLKANNAGAYTVSYAGNPRFAGNTAPTLTSSATDFLFFVCESDTNYLVTSQVNAPAYQ